MKKLFSASLALLMVILMFTFSVSAEEPMAVNVANNDTSAPGFIDAPLEEQPDMTKAGTKTYSFSIHTYDKLWAGTDSSVYIGFVGENGRTSYHLLNNSGDDFERNDMDSYNFTDIDVGTIQEITILKHGTDDWYLDYVQMGGTKYSVVKWLEDNEMVTVRSSDSYCVKQKISMAGMGKGNKTYTVNYYLQSDARDSTYYLQVWGDKGYTDPVKVSLDISDYLSYTYAFDYYHTITIENQADVGTVKGFILTKVDKKGTTDNIATTGMDDDLYGIYEENISGSYCIAVRYTGNDGMEYHLLQYSGSDVFSDMNIGVSTTATSVLSTPTIFVLMAGLLLLIAVPVSAVVITKKKRRSF